MSNENTTSVSVSFNSLIDRLEKCHNADPLESTDPFDRKLAIQGWIGNVGRLINYIEEQESKYNLR